MEDTYNKETARERIKEILDSPYERMYPFEIETELGKLFKKAEENRDEEIMQEIRWEFDLLNRTFGHVGDYNGQRVEEISNKWQHILKTKKFIPFKNIPFCEWKEEALDYYKKRYEEATSHLSKARYAFAIMVFSKDGKIGWAKKSIDEWLKTTEKYIDDEVYNRKYYEIPPFAYEFALKLSLKLNQKEIARNILSSLHKNIIKILESGEKRWYLEFFEVESQKINKFEDMEGIKKESVEKLKEEIKRLKEEFGKSDDKNNSNHFLRHHLKILSNYGTEDQFYLDKKIAESFILEADAREDPLIRSAFLEDAIKHYKLMQSEYSNTNHKEEINKKIEELTLKIKETSKNPKYKTFESSTTIKKEDVRKIIENLDKKNPFYNLLEIDVVIPRYQQSEEMTKEIKRRNPLSFIIPHTISKKDMPLIKYSSEEEIFNFKVRQNILIGIKIGGIMVKMVLEELKNELEINSFEEANNFILGVKEIEDIKDTLEKGFFYVFSEQKDLIAGIHILIPYFEEIIRRILEKAGKKDAIIENQKKEETQKTKYFRKIELGTLLSDGIVKEIIGEDFQKTLKVLLVDNDQMNLRQDLAHGLLTPNRINEEDSLYVAYCLLRLVLILKEIKPKT